MESGVYYGWAGISFENAFSDAAKAATPKTPQGNPQGSTQTTSSHDEQIPTESNGSSTRGEVFPMVMSIGWNPFYKNEVRSVEVHIIHQFKNDFYNALMNLSILGFIRPELDYKSMEALIADINFDIEVAKASLERPAYKEYAEDPYLIDFRWDHSP